MSLRCLHAGWTGPNGLSLRDETADDTAFVAALYASSREQEMSVLDWPEEAKLAFLFEQYTLQRDHYRTHYSAAEFLVLERNGEPVGRIYIKRGSTEIRLMEISLLASLRGQGIGSVLLDHLMAEARERNQCITLHVEPDNPAQRLYSRLGFELREQRGIYDFLEWRPTVTA